MEKQEMQDIRQENNDINVLSEIWQWTKAILAAIVIALLVRGFIFEPVLVDGPSMENTLQTGEKLILYKLGTFFHAPEKGDIVVLEIDEGKFAVLKFLNQSNFAKKVLPTFYKEIDYIKRVVATEGDLVDIIDGYLYINNVKQDEPYVKQGGTTAIRTNMIDFPYEVGADELIVLGDNRINSKDSREIGPVPVSSIKGKAMYRIWPFDHFGRLE